MIMDSRTQHGNNRRRSTRKRTVAADRINLPSLATYSSKRRHLIASFLPATHANASTPLVNLPPELLDMITSHLQLHDIICLSITCRAMFYGYFSHANTYLWYRVGGFENALPGYDRNWEENAIMNLSIMKGRGQCSSSDDEIERLSLRPALNKWNPHLTEYVPDWKGLPITGCSYREMLMQVLRGETESGCMRCLQRPRARRWFREWGLRLCEPCFVENRISTKNLSSLRRAGVEYSQLPIDGGNTRSARKAVYGVYRPHLDRLVRTTLNTHESFAQYDLRSHGELLQEHNARDIAWCKYRVSHRQSVFAKMKEIWCVLRRGDDCEKYQAHMAHVSQDAVKELRVLKALAIYVAPSKLVQKWFFSTSPDTGYQCWHRRPYQKSWHSSFWLKYVNVKTFNEDYTDYWKAPVLKQWVEEYESVDPTSRKNMKRKMGARDKNAKWITDAALTRLKTIDQLLRASHKKWSTSQIRVKQLQNAAVESAFAAIVKPCEADDEISAMVEKGIPCCWSEAHKPLKPKHCPQTQYYNDVQTYLCHVKEVHPRALLFGKDHEGVEGLESVMDVDVVDWKFLFQGTF